MRSEFLAGFVKQATELGHTEEAISSVWKSAMENPEMQAYYNSLPLDEKTAFELDDLEVLSNAKNILNKQAEIKRFKAILDSVCE